MALVDKLPNETLEVPGEPGNHFTFRTLSADEIDDAHAGSARDMVESLGVKTMEALSHSRPQPKENDDPDVRAAEALAVKEAADPLASYSLRTLVEHGLVSWTGPGYGDVACDKETKKRLTVKTRRWAAERVFALSEITEGEVPSSGNGSDAGPAANAA